MKDLDALYQSVIVDHDRAPRNAGPLPGATHHATIDNPLCGDVVTLHLLVEDGVIRTATFDAHGCALSRAAASILTTHLHDLPLSSAVTLAATFDTFVRAPADTDAPADASLGDLTAFAGVRRFRSRQACALLPFRALLTALDR
jgi:nitrogen fixation NifU-like protein